MTNPDLDFNTYVDAVSSHAMALGEFERFTQHEPKGPPGQGMSVAFWFQAIGPLPLASGLAETAIRLEITCRFYQPMLSEPQDAIDPRIVQAAGALFKAYHGDFTLGGAVRNIDLLGAFGVGLSGQAGYQTIDRTMYRVFSIVIPLIIDVWEQAP